MDIEDTSQERNRPLDEKGDPGVRPFDHQPLQGPFDLIHMAVLEGMAVLAVVAQHKVLHGQVEDRCEILEQRFPGSR